MNWPSLNLTNCLLAFCALGIGLHTIAAHAGDESLTPTSGTVYTRLASVAVSKEMSGAPKVNCKLTWENPWAPGLGPSGETLKNQGQAYPQCGEDYPMGEFEVPHVFITAISSAQEHACDIGVDHVRCWNYLDRSSHQYQTDDRRYVDEEVPTLDQPVSISTGNDFACALDRTGVHCWHPATWDNAAQKWVFNSEGSEVSVPALSHPTLISAGFSHACALDDAGVHCWGANSFGQLDVPPLLHPYAIAAGYGFSCAVDESGLRCWGRDSTDAKIVNAGSESVSAKADFNLDQIKALNQLLIRKSSPARARYFLGLSDFIQKDLTTKQRNYSLSLARYLMVSLMTLPVLTDDSQEFKQILAPHIQKSLRNIEDELQIHGTPQVPTTELTRAVALQSMHSAVSVLMEFLSPEDRIPLLSAQRLIGRALADPMDNTSLTTLLSTVDDLAPLVQKAEANPKAAFLVHAVQLADEWLKGSAQ